MQMKRLSVLGMLFLIVAFQSGCGPVAAPQELRSVKVIPVSEGKSDQMTALSGNLVPKDFVRLSFKVNGVVENVLVKEGDTVTKGQVIATLKAEDYKLAMKATQGQLATARMSVQRDIPSKAAQAKAQLALTQVTHDRVAQLFEAGSASKAEMDEIAAKLTVDQETYRQAQDALEIANSNLRQLEAANEMAQSNLDAAVLKSPTDGIVLSKWLAEGEGAGAGVPVALIGSGETIWAEFGVTDSQLKVIKKGQQYPVAVYGSEVSVQGTVQEIGSLADEKTRLFKVRLSLSGNTENLKPGMIATMKIKTGSSAVRIPFISVVHQSDGDRVFVYSEADKTVHMKAVRTGNLIDDTIEILEGVKEGDLLVVEGQYQIRDQERVVRHD